MHLRVNISLELFGIVSLLLLCLHGQLGSLDGWTGVLGKGNIKSGWNCARYELETWGLEMVQDGRDEKRHT